MCCRWMVREVATQIPWDHTTPITSPEDENRTSARTARRLASAGIATTCLSNSLGRSELTFKLEPAQHAEKEHKQAAEAVARSRETRFDE